MNQGVTLLGADEARTFKAAVRLRLPGDAPGAAGPAVLLGPEDTREFGSSPRLRGTRGIAPATAAVTISRRQERHASEGKHSESARLTDADFDRLPEIIAHPQAVLRDLEPKESQGNMLLWVFQPADADRRGKIVVELDMAASREDRTRTVTNDIRTAGYVQPENLRGARYEVLYGETDN